MIHLSVLYTEEVEAIHQATLRILSETGVALAAPRNKPGPPFRSEGRRILLDAGARERAGRICPPPALAERALATCPPQVRLRGRGGTVKTLGDGSLHWHNLGAARDVYDHRTGRRRPALTQDVRDVTRLLDA